jgi:hypothetical protein
MYLTTPSGSYDNAISAANLNGAVQNKIYIPLFVGVFDIWRV